MRYLFLYLGFVLPQTAAAQLIRHFEVGSYVLQTEPTVAHPAGLYTPDGQQLLVHDLSGRTETLTPLQVSSFRMAGRRFVTTGGFTARTGGNRGYVPQAFAEQLDSGQVMLLRYTNPAGTTSGVSQSGAFVYGGPSSSTVYLLRTGNKEAALTTVESNWSRRDPQLLAALRPYLAARPDLLQLLEAKRLAPKQLPIIIHALNSGQPLPGGVR